MKWIVVFLALFALARQSRSFSLSKSSAFPSSLSFSQTLLGGTTCRTSTTRSFSSSSPLSETTFQQSRETTSTTTTTTTTTTARSTASSPDDDDDDDVKVVGDITFVISASEKTSKFGKNSPVGHPSVAQAVEQLARKVVWFANGRVQTSVVVLASNEDSNDKSHEQQQLQLQLCHETDVLIAIGIESEQEMDQLETIFAHRRQQGDAALRQRQCHFALDCARPLPAKVGPYLDCDCDSSSLSSLWQSATATLLPWTTQASARRLAERMHTAFARWTSDDFCYALVLFLNRFSGHELDWVKHTTEATWEKGPIQNAREFFGMLEKCSDCVQNCVADDKCRECIGKLTEIDPNDQVTSYRTIVSYESQLLRDFSLCILTKNNIFNCDASIPTLPDVQPITTWRGNALTEQDGKDILVGHLDDPVAPTGSRQLPTSWIVAAGANVAYDQFPSQNQIFYPVANKNTNAMWYDPVFRVETLDGRHVWCHRHYRVRPQSALPGTFRFSVLDNGVTSDEYWNIIGAADDLAWVCFHYAGAASAVGQQYLGGLVCTPDGAMPDASQLPEVYKCLHAAGIEPWELCVVNNDPQAPGAIAAGPPPLDIYRSKVMPSAQ